MADLRRRRDEVTRADLVELRLDTVADPDPAGAVAGHAIPVIVTCRPRWEGGHFAGSEEERKRLLLEAQRLGAEYVDVEWKAGFRELFDASGGRGLVLSMHDFHGVPDDLMDRAAAMRSSGAEVIKLAITAHRLADCLALPPVARSSARPTAVVAMGEPGIPSRVLASRFGSCWSYAGDGAAPGQLPVSRMLDELSFKHLGTRTAIYGVVGKPVMHSLSPAMHNQAFRATRLDAVYLPLAAVDFDDFLTFADAVELAGASVTAPFKVDAYRRADRSDALSRRIEAANTLRRAGSEWLASNTDVAGFLAPLGERLELRDARVTVLGAGGAARAVVEGLRSAGARVSIAARRRDAALELAARSGSSLAPWPPPADSWDVLVNATSVGTAPASGDTPLPHGPFTGQLVYDLVYNPPETQLLRDARAAGCETLGGLDMLVAQAALQFQWWTGHTPSADVMRDAAIRALR
jgi:3-dehydroquinate dehydratase/shikimate dehydrogenase